MRCNGIFLLLFLVAARYAKTFLYCFVPHAVNCGRFCFWRRQCGFLVVYKISREPLNGFVPNSHGRRVWSLTPTSLKVNVKGQGHQGQKRHFRHFSVMFCKISLASSSLFWGSHRQRNRRTLEADILLTGRQNRTKFGRLIEGLAIHQHSDW